MKELLSEEIIVIPHERHNQSQGVITCALLKGYKDEEITEGLAEQGVISCRLIIRNAKSPNPEPIATLILTFNTANPPDRIIIRTGLIERVRLYIPLPRRCFNCHRYGHSGAKCRKLLPVCGRCAEDIIEDHNSETCTQPIKCANCLEPHHVSSKSCPKYLLEKEILTLKTKEHLSFAEARAKINTTFNPTSKSYASAAAMKPKNRTEDTITNNNYLPNLVNEKTDNSPNHRETDVNNNNSNNTPNHSDEQRISTKRTLCRTDSSSPERTEVRKPLNKPPKIPKHDRNHRLHAKNDIEPMETTIPPDRTHKRNSAPDLLELIQKENDILNNARKSFKDKKKEKNAQQHKK